MSSLKELIWKKGFKGLSYMHTKHWGRFVRVHGGPEPGRR